MDDGSVGRLDERTEATAINSHLSKSPDRYSVVSLGLLSKIATSSSVRRCSCVDVPESVTSMGFDVDYWQVASANDLRQIDRNTFGGSECIPIHIGYAVG